MHIIVATILIILAIVLLTSVPHIIKDEAFLEKFGIRIRRHDNPVMFWTGTLLVFLIGVSFLAISCLQIIKYLS